MKTTADQRSHRREIHAEAIEQSNAAEFTMYTLTKPKRAYKPRPKTSRKVCTSVRLLPEQIAELKLAGSMDKGITAAMRDSARCGAMMKAARAVIARAYTLQSDADVEELADELTDLESAIDAELQRTPTEVKA